MRGISGFPGVLSGGKDDRRGAGARGGRTGGTAYRRPARWVRVALVLTTGVALSCLGNGETWAASAKASAGAPGASAASAQLWQPRGLSAAQGAGAAGALADPAAAGSWQFEQPADATSPGGVLLADSCTAAAACEAVGEHQNSVGTTVTLAEARASAGASWEVRTTPNLAGAVASELTGVACISAASCLAVGYEVAASGDVVPLAEWWNGTSWIEQSVPTEAGSAAAGFFAVSCSPDGACTAAGEYDASSGASVPLVEQWSSAAGWSIGTGAEPAGALDAGLFGVSCPAAGACVAVGSYENAAGTELPLAESESGGTWTVASVPSPAGAETNDLPGVSCAKRTSCVAVGYTVSSSGTDSPLADAWNGSSWTALAPAEPTGTHNAQLLSISCVSADACTAAGDYAGASGSGEPLAEGWNATVWTVQSTIAPAEESASISPNSGSSSGSSSGFAAVSCGSASSCSAVGSQASELPPVVTLAERWNGTSWLLEATPDLPGAIGTNTAGVSCATADFCAAVGFAEHGGGPTVPFIESWNGHTWSLRAVPVPADAAYGELRAVSCVSPSACLAVGTYGNASGTSLPISEHWNGVAWTLLSTAAPAGATGSELLGVSCASATDCDAVGGTTDSAGNQGALAEHWNGTGWTLSTVPTPTGGSSAGLNGISCAAAQACIAVGSYVTSAQTRSVLAETWDGTRWRAQDAPNPAGQGLTLASVSCVAADSCTAVGGYYDTAGAGVSLAEAWNGKAWSIQSSASPAGVSELALNGVSCTSADACTAVGYYETNDFVPTIAFAEAWNGSTWALQNTPIPAGGNTSLLNAVSCIPSSCTAAGYYFGYSGTQLALIEERG